MQVNVNASKRHPFARFDARLILGNRIIDPRFCRHISKPSFSNEGVGTRTQDLRIKSPCRSLLLASVGGNWLCFIAETDSVDASA